jgi:hypothetical protein
VLAALGPPTRCRRCRRERRARHLLRLRGLDEIHGLVCPACGQVLRSYLRYGASGGLEALEPLSRELGLVAEVQVGLGDASAGLQMLPEERERLVVAALRRLIVALLFAPLAIPVEARHLELWAGRRALGPRDRIPPGRLTLRLVGAPLGQAAALDLLRSRIERRFRQ